MEIPLNEFNNLEGNFGQKIKDNPRDWRTLQEHTYDIDGPEFTSVNLGESVIESGSSATGAVVAGTGLGSSAAAVVPAVGLLAAGAVAGGVISAHYPGHQYLGPGTDIKVAKEPVDTDDEIAKSHDLEYAKAKTYEDIQRADDKAIGSFDKDFEKTGSIHSKIASTLLGVKRTAEEIVGPIYPKV